ncbi:DNA mismatch repair endonuclease MutL [Alkalicoccobacillus murimartini]|uniref:DNA mismatch repair protein MutL n=1 Tax=Alkalicoccobacillus murimartini TaxID=171685 RepID=A0ABT9YEV9_9BACI|nr:DNA mismatch repair endonuclease MutL [Alkalicoccobacillus murimartini]MDQ0206261.1 DNA mismatch repair protein MutL [Alkalicoccobacillus murimartini]
MAAIRQLDDALSNKIAAGEVVERPASIVKELVENALDAGSTTILVELEEAGLRSIRVVDNGSGMAPEDVETAFLRHATSKIQTDRDLFNIHTLGFRGEALPSIASVSHVLLKTSTGVGEGVELQLEGGRLIKRLAAHSRKGTELVISQLFYNTPARLKYLKTSHTEAGHVSDVMNRLAMSNPHVSFEYVHNNKQVLKSSGNGDIRQVMAQIYGRSVATKLVTFEESSLDYKVTGFVCRPEINRSSRQYMSVYINGRYIRNYALAGAIMQGYHTLLPIGRFPVAVIQIEMNPTLVDVNVHPAKLEVRLSKEAELGTLLTTAIKTAFQQEQLIPEQHQSKPKQTKAADVSTQLPLAFEEEHQKSPMQQPHANAQDHSVLHVRETEPISFNKPAETQERKQEDEVLETKDTTPLVEDVERPSVTESTNQPRIPAFYPIGQMHGTYILAQNEDGLYLIDQHAAQERINYEYFRVKVAEQTPHIQELLTPFTIEFTAHEASVIESNLDKLEAVGVFLDSFGHQTFRVRSHPVWFPNGLEEETVRELLDQLLTNARIDIGKLREDAAILMACKAAIKANRHLRDDEIESLLQTLRTCEDPFTCPHGRPVIIHFTTYEMEKMFKRVM